MIQLHNFFFFLIFLVVLCGTAAPVLLKWFFSRDVSTGAPSFNGTIIPIPISLFSLLIYLHSRKIIRSMDGAGVLVSASRPFVLADVIGSSETLARKVLFLCVPVVHFCLLKSKVVLDFSYLESFCGVLCLLFFCTFFFLTDLKGERTRRRKGQRLWNELRRNDKISKHLERKVEGPLSFSIGQGGSVVPGVPQEMVPFTLPRNQQLITKAVSHYLPMKMIISHGGVCIFMLGVLLSNAKKIQLTQRLPLGSELDMGSERCCLRGLDHLHGPTSHSICGNLMIYKPASLRLKKDHLMFGDDSSYNNGKLEHFMNWWNRRHRHFGLSMFPEKRYFGERASTAEVAIHTNLFTDLYASIGTGSSRTGGWYTTIMKLPFIFLIWIGFLLASLGGSPSLLRQLKKSKLRWNRTQVHKCIIENSVEVNE